MIIYTVLLLFIIGALSSIKTGVKVDKVLTFVSFTSIFIVFADFCESMIAGETHTFSFMWNTSQGQDIKFDIVSNPYNYALIMSCFAVTVLACLHNLLFRYEERRAAYNAILCFNLISLILLITSNNFVQLISALFITDILAMFLMKNNENCRLFGMMNMLADMLLFMVMAIINARVDSLDLEQVLLYRQIGVHTDWTAVVGLTAIFIKFGFFVFQRGMLELKDIRFHRIQNVLFLSSPFAALILLLKFNALWRVSAYFTLYLDIMCVATGLWAFCHSVWVNHFKAKAIYWMMAFWALMVELLRFSDFVWLPEYGKLILEMYVFMTALSLLYAYNNRRNLTTQMMQLRLTHKKRLASVLLIIMLMIMASAHTLSAIYNAENRFYIWGFAALLLLSVAVVIGQIYFYQGRRYAGMQNDIKFKWVAFIELMVLSIWLLRSVQIDDYAVWGSVILFTILVLLPLQKMRVLYEVPLLQENRILDGTYRKIVRSLRTCGRLSGLLIDRVVLEKIMLPTAVAVSTVCIRMFRRLHSSPILGGLTVLCILGATLWYSYRYALGG